MTNTPQDAGWIATRLHRLSGLNQTQIDALSLSLDPVQVDQINDADLASLVNGTLPGLPRNPSGGLPLGLPGAVQGARFVGGTTSGAPTTGTFAVRDWVIDGTGAFYACTVAGSPGTWVQVSGGGGAASLTPTAVKTGSYTAAAADLVPVDTTSGAVTVTLPTAPADKTQILVKHVVQGGTNAVTIARGGSSDVFNKAGGATSLTLPYLNQAMLVQYKASTGVWYVVAEDLPVSAVQTFGNSTYIRTVNGSAPDGTGDVVVAAGGSGVSIDGAAQTNVDIASAAPAAADVGAVPQLTPTAVKTGSYTAVAGDFIPVDTTSGGVTVTLPAAPADGVRVGVAHIIQGSTNIVTINRGGTTAVFNKTGGSTSVSLSTVNQKMFFTYRSASAIWEVENSLSLGSLDLRFAAITGGGASLTNTQKRDLVMPNRNTGVLAWTGLPVLFTAAVTMVSTLAKFCGSVRLYAGDVHTNIVIPSGTTAGVGITEVRAYLTDMSGVVLARSNDMTSTLPGGSGAWTASKAMTFPLTSPYTPGSETDALVVLIAVATTMPTLNSPAGIDAGVLDAAGRLPASWGGNSAGAGFSAGSFPAVGATITLPTTRTSVAYAHLT